MAILIILVILFACLAIYAFITRKKINEDIELKIIRFQNLQDDLLQRNEQLQTKNRGLEVSNIGLYKEKENLQESIQALKTEKTNLDFNIASLLQQNKSLETENLSLRDNAKTWEMKVSNAKAELDASLSAAKASAAAQEEIAKKAFSSYCETLESAYSKAEEEHDLKINSLQFAINQEQKQLNEISATRAAAQQALLKEQEIKENKDNYRLLPTSFDLDDIKELEKVRRILHKPRVLSMLVWQTYWQPLAKTRFPIILQDKTKMGVYKITNIQTNECYIGQAVDIYKRWNEHCKCGLGIDTPPGNKLYKAMQDYGLENFTFELLTECSKEELDNKERYFIELYQAKEYGYNGTVGNKKI